VDGAEIYASLFKNIAVTKHPGCATTSMPRGVRSFPFVGSETGALIDLFEFIADLPLQSTEQ
jgi:hypothetical protein